MLCSLICPVTLSRDRAHAQKALLPGDSEVQQLLHTFMLLGTPNEEIWPGVSQLKVRDARGRVAS